jgi:hypothetical protein
LTAHAGDSWAALGERSRKKLRWIIAGFRL